MYVTEVPSTSSLGSWERMGDLTGEHTIRNDTANPGAHLVVEVLDTDIAFTTQDCGVWTLRG